MKAFRLVSMVLLMALAMWQGSFAALSESPAAVQFQVETPVVVPGDTLVLALHIAEPVDFYYAGFEVGFNSGAFSLLDVQHSGLSSPGLSVAELLRPGRAGASVSRTASLQAPASGTLALIRFTVNGGSAPGSYPFEVYNLEVAASNGQDIDVTLPLPATVSVEEPEPQFDPVPSAFVLAEFDLNEGLQASQAQPENMGAELTLSGAVFTGLAAGYEGQSASSNSWMGGSDGSAYWQVTVSTQGFRDISVSSRQFGSGSGPRDFLLYGSVNGSEWIQLSADTIRLSSTSWSAAQLDNLSLPVQFEDQSQVILRWVMVSEARIDTGEPISSTAGTSRIDAISVRGYQLNPVYVDVWPGDTNNDGTVNADDVLPLGVFWLHYGPQPFLPGTEFAARTVEQWLPAGATFADTNGDGRVDHRDLRWIGMHFGNNRLGKALPGMAAREPSGVLSRLQISEDLYTGREFRIAILDDVIENLHGLAWRLRIEGAEPDQVGLIMPPHHQDLLSFMLSPESGINEGAMVFKQGQRPEGEDFRVELWLQLYENLEGPLELILERLTVVDGAGVTGPGTAPLLKRLDVVSNQENGEAGLPAAVLLHGNYPNPFNPSTRIRFSLAEPMPVRLEVYDLHGRLVAVPSSGIFSSGNHSVTFDGSGLATGVYMVRLNAAGVLLQRKMTLIK